MSDLPPGVVLHHEKAPAVVSVALLTVSDTRTPETDASGDQIATRLGQAGHRLVVRSLVPDDPNALDPLLEGWAARDDIDAILITGGTGIASRDQTVDTVEKLLTRALPGYGELFRMLSFAEIGPAAMLSRAVGGLMGRVVVLVMPGSQAAVDLAMDRLILPELPHLVREARR